MGEKDHASNETENPTLSLSGGHVPAAGLYEAAAG
jgi:hypothetical protein